jgi:hypothetical protein
MATSIGLENQSPAALPKDGLQLLEGRLMPCQLDRVRHTPLERAYLVAVLPGALSDLQDGENAGAVRRWTDRPIRVSSVPRARSARSMASLLRSWRCSRKRHPPSLAGGWTCFQVLTDRQPNSGRDYHAGLTRHTAQTVPS